MENQYVVGLLIGLALGSGVGIVFAAAAWLDYLERKRRGPHQ